MTPYSYYALYCILPSCQKLVTFNEQVMPSITFYHYVKNQKFQTRDFWVNGLEPHPFIPEAMISYLNDALMQKFKNF